MKNVDKIQNLLPIGYLYLVILGVIKESIVFYQLGINIIKYSTVMDILLSPIAVMTSHPLIFVVFLFMGFFPLMSRRVFLNNNSKPWVRSFLGVKKNKAEMTEKEIESYSNLLVYRGFIFMYLSLFLGAAIQQGYSTSQKIKNNELKYNYQVSYNTGDSEIISLIDSNSEYYFCISQGSKNIKIVPIESVKSLEIIHNPRLDE